MRICIIGGRGNFGQFFSKIFKSQGHEVFIIGRNNVSKLKSFINKSDIIIMAVPGEAVKIYYEQLAKIVRPGQLVIDISSVMSPNEKYLIKLKCHTAFLHPLFAPNIQNLKSAKYILAPVKVKNKKLLQAIISVLEKTGSIITETSVDQHEKSMAYIQALSHFNNILLAKVISESEISVNEIETFSTTFFRLQFDTLSRIFAQGSKIYADIQFNNQVFVEVLKLYEKSFNDLAVVVKKKDYLAYDDIFKQIICRFSHLLKDSFDESQSLVQSLPVISKKVGYLGPAGSYSEAAAEYLKPGANFIIVKTITDVIKMVNDGALDFGVVPIENSIQGSVTETVDGLYQNKLFIDREVVLPINHCVASLSSELRKEKVEIVLSHPQALGQCSDYLNANFSTAKQINTDSTSEAFRKIADESLVKAVAVGTVSAAEKYGLKILARNIQNVGNNETKFILISKNFNVNSKGQISSFVVAPKKDCPGLLFDILQNLKENNLNLSKIESRPSKMKLGTYVFNLNIDGNFRDQKIQKALKGIKKEADITFLGSYNTEKYDHKS